MFMGTHEGVQAMYLTVKWVSDHKKLRTPDIEYSN